MEQTNKEPEEHTTEKTKACCKTTLEKIDSSFPVVSNQPISCWYKYIS